MISTIFVSTETHRNRRAQQHFCGVSIATRHHRLPWGDECSRAKGFPLHLNDCEGFGEKFYRFSAAAALSVVKIWMEKNSSCVRWKIWRHKKKIILLYFKNKQNLQSFLKPSGYLKNIFVPLFSISEFLHQPIPMCSAIMHETRSNNITVTCWCRNIDAWKHWLFFQQSGNLYK